MPQANDAGANYVAYLFAHDTSSDGLIQCGSTAGGKETIGWEPQFILHKSVNFSQDWEILDASRGLPWGAAPKGLKPNLSEAENNSSVSGTPKLYGDGFELGAISGTHIYVAIRRSNKIPTSGLQVFNAVARTGTSGSANVACGFAADLNIIQARANAYGAYWFDRMRGATREIKSFANAAETVSVNSLTEFLMDGVSLGIDSYENGIDRTYINYFLRRAPGFFDVVAYLGNSGTPKTVPHGLGVPPELIIVKSASSSWDWPIYHTGIANPSSSFMHLNTTAGRQPGSGYWNAVAPNSTVFSIGVGGAVNAYSDKYVAYLFATFPGISKVGSYTGNGSSQTINCGFAGGARFVLIKRSDAAGDWFVWDTPRGIIAGNDSHLSMNNLAAEVTTDDSIDPDNSGFIVNQVAATSINVSGGSYIFLAIA